MIKKMLDSANLEEVTMKTVLKDVSWDGVLVFKPIIKTYKAYKKSRLGLLSSSWQTG